MSHNPVKWMIFVWFVGLLIISTVIILVSPVQNANSCNELCIHNETFWKDHNTECMRGYYEYMHEQGWC